MQRYQTVFLVVLILITGSSFCFAQEDSGLAVPKARPMYGTYHDFERGMRNLKQIDTGLNQLQKFDPGYLHNLGTPGSPAFPLIWDPFKTTGFDLGFHQWDIYRLTNENLRYYNTQNPYAELFYGQGASDIQTFRATFSQNIRQYWNFSLLIDALTTNKGYYDNQGTQVNRFAGNTWYQSPNGRYMLIFGAAFKNFQAQENGGLQSDSLFLALPESKKAGLPVNFGTFALPVSPKQVYNENYISVKQYYRFGPADHIKVRDTDSIATRIIHPRYFISHSFDYHYNKYTYMDQGAGFPYKYAFLEPALTNDAYQYEEFANKIAIGRAEFNRPVRVAKKIDSTALKNPQFFYQVFAKYSIIKGYQVSDYVSDHLNTSNASTGFEIEKDGKIGLLVSGEYFLAGYNQDDYLLKAQFNLPFIKKILPRVNFSLKTQQATPAYTEQLFLGNHFFWQNQFKSSKFNEAGAWFSDSLGLNIGGFYRTAANLIYYDSFPQPVQDPGTVSFVQFFLSKDFRIGPVHMINNIYYQKGLTNSYDVRVPEWLFRLSWYYEHYLFKKAMLFQGGFDFSYSSAYKGYGYMPEISRFYVQDNAITGNYQVWDLWVAGKVKRFAFFAKLEHLNQGLSGGWYFVVPHYPLYPLSYRFGVRWMFFN